VSSWSKVASRIYVGNFTTEAEAEKLQVAMKKLYPDCKVIKYDGMKYVIESVTGRDLSLLLFAPITVSLS
jgi:ribosomal protein L36